MHLSFHTVLCLDMLLSLTKQRPLAEPGNRAPGIGRPRSRDKALCHPALSLGNTASSGVEMAQSGPGDRETIPRSEMEVEEDWRRSEEEVGQGCLPDWGAKRAA